MNSKKDPGILQTSDRMINFLLINRSRLSLLTNYVRLVTNAVAGEHLKVVVVNRH